MADRPIIFSGEMVGAILEGRKTQTRRLIRPQPYNGETEAVLEYCGEHPNKRSPYWYARFDLADEEKTSAVSYGCPYGVVGDRLYVRETFVIESTRDYEAYVKVEIPDDRPVKRIGDCWEDGDYYLIPHYRATEPEPHIVPDNLEDGLDDRTRWRSPYHMPRWAARIWLEVTAIRVERVQEITIGDFVREGHPNNAPTSWFPELWDSLNAKHGFSWDSNPWVWVVEFKRIEGGDGD